MEYLSSKNKSMHCRGEAVRTGRWGEGQRVGGDARKRTKVTFYDIDTLPLSRVFLRVVRGGKIPSIRFFDPGPTLPSWCHS